RVRGGGHGGGGRTRVDEGDLTQYLAGGEPGDLGLPALGGHAELPRQDEEEELRGLPFLDDAGGGGDRPLHAVAHHPLDVLVVERAQEVENLLECASHGHSLSPAP